jgi:UDP-glucose 4-epimerase
VLSEKHRVLITGGAGLVGSHLADLLVRQFNPEIVILDNFSRGRRDNLRWALTHGQVEIIEGDIRDAALVHEAVDGVDIVFHQAAVRVAQCNEDPRLALEVLADGTFNVLEAAALNGVRKVVAASCASVYGEPDQLPTAESHHCCNTRNLYSTGKAFNEGLLRSFHDMYGVDYITLRYYNVYGPRMDVTGTYTEVIIRWMERLAQRQPCVVNGDGTQTMDLIYVEDIARANLLAAMSPVTDETFNIASGVETSLNTLAATIGRIMGSNLPPEYAPQRKNIAVTRRCADPSKAERILGFRAQVDLEEGLSRLVSWWERQRALEAAIA